MPPGKRFATIMSPRPMFNPANDTRINFSGRIHCYFFPPSLIKCSRIQGKNGQGNDFERGIHCRKRHGGRRLASPVPVASCPDDPAHQEENGVKVNNSYCRHIRYQTQLHEQHGNQDCHKDFQEALDPKMDDPKSPGVDH